MNSYFSLSDKIYDITEKYPELIDFLVVKGFTQLQNKMLRSTMGKTISLEKALLTKHYDVASFEKEMVELIERKNLDNSSDLGVVKKAVIKDNSDEITIKGVLPCPIRVQILQQVEQWIKQKNLSVNYNLPAASMGLDWLETEIRQSCEEADLADIYLSAGFNLFFDKKLLGHYSENNVFADITGIKKLNPIFDNDYIDLKDPKKQYYIIGVVPAIFSVNEQLLGDRKFPRSWEDLLSPEFENTIALPMKDLDLFNAVLLGIYKAYGAEGVAKLGRNLMRSMHPAQMVKEGKQKKSEKTPLITIMPYFFTCMINEKDALKPVWPSDGAIISPIFLLCKKSAQEKIKPLIDFLTSAKMGEVLSVNGKFPSTSPEVDNHLDTEQKFLWAGWDFIHSHDIGKLLVETENIFLNACGGK